VRNPPQDLRDHLVDAGIGFTKGVNIFTGSLRAAKGVIPVNAAFVNGVDGLPPIRSMGEVEEILTSVVSITLRWGTSGGGDSLMRTVRDTVQGASITGYLDVLAQGSEPIPLGEDADGNHQFMAMVEMTYIQAA